jgi:hypothetical protein
LNRPASRHQDATAKLPNPRHRIERSADSATEKSTRSSTPTAPARPSSNSPGRFAISRTTVMAHLNRRSEQRRAAAKEWDDDALGRAARSYANGNSLAHIADEFGIDPSTVTNRLRKARIPIRPRRGWT